QVGSLGRIQEAINLLADGSLTGGARVINVEAGTYKENDSVNKSVSIIGPNSTAGYGVRSSEAIVVTNGNQAFPDFPVGTTNAVFTVSPPKVTTRGLTIDGDDTAVTGSPIQSGADANTIYGILASGSGLQIVDNIIENLFIGFRGDGTSDANLISNNWIHDI